MGLHSADSQGIKISYFPTITGFLDHISIRFQYNDDYERNYDPNLLLLAPLFTEKSLEETREFLYKHSVSSVEINLPEKWLFRDEKLPIHLNKLYEALGIRLGELIKSISSINTVYVARVTQDNFFPLLELFQNHLSEKLETSLAKPKLIMQVKSASIDNDPPKILEGVSYSVGYSDRRTFAQKAYHFFANIPILGLLIRAVTYLFCGDSESKYFTNSSRKIDDINYYVTRPLVEEKNLFESENYKNIFDNKGKINQNDLHSQEMEENESNLNSYSF